MGLAILRVGTGAAALQAGLIKALDFSTTVGFMADAGWRLPGLAAFMVTAAETLGGLCLLLGALTPLAACAVLRAVQPAVPDRCRRGGAAVHRCRPVLARRWTACPYHLVDAGTPGAGGARGDRRCGDMGRALRGEPDPSHDALVLTATGR